MRFGLTLAGAVASGVAALALIGTVSGAALDALVRPLVRDAAFALGGRTAEARVTGVAEGEARVVFTAAGERVETVATGTYDLHHDPRDVEVRYLPGSPEEAALADHAASWGPALLTALVVVALTSAWLVRSWHGGGTSASLRARLRRQAPPLPIARWVLPAVLCLVLGALVCTWPYLGATPEEMVLLDPSLTWFAVGTAVLLTSVPMMWRAAVRHAALNRAPVSPHSPSSKRMRGAVNATLVLGCLLILAVPGYLFVDHVRSGTAMASGPEVRGTVEAMDRSTGRGCWFDVRVSYRVEDLPHERTLELGCSEQRGLAVGDTVLLETSAAEPHLVRIADRSA
ncbi:DUF3592 domain-containing protein [Nocardiopsis dassonvillei]|uniref:DUF3592 domain-containing protein n=1 Tax=Nocardiopsis TaxID=2013 RepID=UPI00200D2E12|nr:DUF3592 domain-containing protein [Nocardiopsis dassonvillei]MCK9872228.1 DUF3592 domain-containing protein [Nocardiopsis dassonvillei]